MFWERVEERICFSREGKAKPGDGHATPAESAKSRDGHATPTEGECVRQYCSWYALSQGKESS